MRVPLKRGARTAVATFARTWIVSDISILRQLKEPSWLVNIGDLGARTLAYAEVFIESRLMIPTQITR